MSDEVKTRDERIQELLDKPAIEATGQIKGPNLADLTTEPTEPVAEEAPIAEDDESKETKVRIPRSRLKTLTSKIDELEARLAESSTYQERVAALEAQLNNKGGEELPDWWKEAYGDTEVSIQGYKNQQRIFREEMTREFERREAERAQAEAARAQEIESIEQSFDDQMDSLEDSVGRELTASQKVELLDIVDEYSPKDDGGRIVAYLPVEKAYEIWSKGQTLDAGKAAMARIASAPSAGNTAASSPQPPSWGDWRKRFGS